MTPTLATESNSTREVSSVDASVGTSGSGVQHLLSQLALAFGSMPWVHKALLFGSRSREDHGDRDDIDLAVSCPEATDDQWAQVERVVAGLPTLLRVDLVRLDTISADKRRIVLLEGIMFFEPWGRRWAQFCEALDRLGWALDRESPDILAREGLLHRFARTVDLFHKFIRRLLWSRGLQDQGLKDALVLAYQQGWIAGEERWLSLLQGRFWVERAYEESRILPLAEKISRHHALLVEARESLRDRFDLD
ncbi:MAG: nucleotidyltransferase substrate binding protein [Fibrobacteria bacterium]|nr:nucleotidyltransferase substrate binding protein [Fibrobacteria bacterium]